MISFEETQTDATSTRMRPLTHMSQDTRTPSESAATDTTVVGPGTPFGNNAQKNAGARPSATTTIDKTLENRGSQQNKIDPQGPIDDREQNDEGPGPEVPPPFVKVMGTLPVAIEGKPWYLCWKDWLPMALSLTGLAFLIASVINAWFSYHVSKDALNLQ